MISYFMRQLTDEQFSLGNIVSLCVRSTIFPRQSFFNIFICSCVRHFFLDMQKIFAYISQRKCFPSLLSQETRNTYVAISARTLRDALTTHLPLKTSWSHFIHCFFGPGGWTSEQRPERKIEFAWSSLTSYSSWKGEYLRNEVSLFRRTRHNNHVTLVTLGMLNECKARSSCIHYSNKGFNL